MKSILTLSELKNENSVINYSPSCYCNPVWVTFSCWTQHTFFWRMLVTKQLVAVDFKSMEKKSTLEVSGYQQLFGYQHSSKYVILWSTEDIYTCLEQVWRQNYYSHHVMIVCWLLQSIYCKAQGQRKPCAPLSEQTHIHSYALATLKILDYGHQQTKKEINGCQTDEKNVQMCASWMLG